MLSNAEMLIMYFSQIPQIPVWFLKCKQVKYSALFQTSSAGVIYHPQLFASSRPRCASFQDKGGPSVWRKRGYEGLSDLNAIDSFLTAISISCGV